VLPDLAGVYILRGEGGVALRIGRARNLRSSVLAHFRPQQGRVSVSGPAHAVRDVDWFETIGELDAQLLEAKLRRQLKLAAGRAGVAARATSVIRLRATDTGAAVAIEPLDDEALGEDAEAYGPFRDELAARRALEGHARHVGLCLKLLGFEHGEGSCVAHQLGHCRGACLGKEPRALHDARLRLALAPQRLRPWPFPGAVAIRESLGWSGGTVVHVIDGWHHLGSARSDDELQALANSRQRAALDPDAYRIVSRWLGRVDPRDCRQLPPRGTGA
jgi:DNA polymerase III subunit epsilon